MNCLIFLKLKKYQPNRVRKGGKGTEEINSNM